MEVNSLTLVEVKGEVNSLTLVEVKRGVNSLRSWTILLGGKTIVLHEVLNSTLYFHFYFRFKFLFYSSYILSICSL